MAELSIISRLYATQLGKTVLAKQAGQSKVLSDNEYFELALSWCRDNKSNIQMFSELTDQAMKKMASPLFDFESAMSSFLESIEKNAEAMRFLATNEWTRQFGAMLTSVDNSDSFIYVCLLLRELSR